MKRKIAVFLALVMILSTLPIMLAAQSPAGPAVLYRLSEDPAFTEAEPGSEFDFEGHPFLTGSNSVITVEVDGGQRLLQVVTDPEDFFPSGLFFPLDALDVGNHIVIRGHADAIIVEDMPPWLFFRWPESFVAEFDTIVATQNAGDLFESAYTLVAADFMPREHQHEENVIVTEEYLNFWSIIGAVEFSITEIVIYETAPLGPYVFNLASYEYFLGAAVGDAISIGNQVVRTHGDVYVAADGDGERYLRVPIQQIDIDINALEPGNFIRIVGRLDYTHSETTIDMHSIWPATLVEVELSEPGEIFVLEYLFREEDFGPREAYHWRDDAEDVIFGMVTPSTVHIWVDYHSVVYSILSFTIYHEYPAGPEPGPQPEYTVMRFTIGSTTWTDDGMQQTLEAAPFIEGNRAMVPLRFVAEALDAEVDLLPGIPRVVTIELGDIELRLTVGEALPGGMGTPVINGGRVFVPIGYVSDVLGVTTRWCDDTNSVYVYVPAQ